MGDIELKASDNFTFGAYEALPSSAPKGGVVVIQEIFGVNPHIRSVVDGYADMGYAAIAPKIFDRVEKNVELGYEQQADFDKGLKIAFNDLEISDTLKDIQATVEALSKHGKVGVVGYCFGGLLTWLSACEISGVAAASAYYGGGTASELARTASCPVMMHFGEKDEHIPMSEVEPIKSSLPDVQVFVYDADHGFNCDVRGSYHEASSTLARERTLEFFANHLG